MLVGGMPQAVDAFIETNNLSIVDQVSSVIAGEKEERVQDSMTVYISYHADDPGAGMSLHKDPRRYKLFLCDTGLFVTLAFKDRDFTENEIYERLLNDKLSTDLGYLYENMVAQIY